MNQRSQPAESAQLENHKEMPSKRNRFATEVFDWVQTFAQALFAVVILFTFLFRFVTVDGHSMDNTLSDKDRLIISDIGYTPQRGDIVVIHDTESEIVETLYDAESDSYRIRRIPAFRGPIIKRIIATEGETVVVDYENCTITVTDLEGNTFVLDEPYVSFTMYAPDSNGNMTSQTLPLEEARDLGSVAKSEPGKMTYPNSVGHLEKHVVAKGCVFVCGDHRSNSLDSRYVGDIDARKILGKALVRVIPINRFGVLEHVDYND